MSRNKLAVLLLLASACLAGAARAEEEDGDATREKARLMQLQADIFRLNVEADYAAALKKLCDTGYGDPKICHRPGGVAAAAGTRASTDGSPPMAEPLPVVAEISGFAGHLTATLAYPDGTRLPVVTPRLGIAGSRLRGGERVIAIHTDRVVLVRDDGEKITLPFKEPAQAGNNPPSGVH